MNPPFIVYWIFIYERKLKKNWTILFRILYRDEGELKNIVHLIHSKRVFELEFFPNRTAPYNLDSSMSLPLKHVVFLPSTRFYTCHRNLPLLRSRSGLLNSTNRHVPCRIGMEETSYTPHIWPREDRSSRLQDSEPHPTWVSLAPHLPFLRYSTPFSRYFLRC